MPRIDPRRSRAAHAVNPRLAQLLPICRDLRSARCELKWMRDHVNTKLKGSSQGARRSLLSKHVIRRSHGEPLQYLLASEFFGNLEIKCRPGVMIPRPETAISTSHLVDLLSSNIERLPKRLRVLDLCTGTGCISLLFHHEFYNKHKGADVDRNSVFLELTGVDISPSAIELAEENKARRLKALASEILHIGLRQQSLQHLAFRKANILCNSTSSDPRKPTSSQKAHHEQPEGVEPSLTEYDVLISNPPYISPADYWRTTSPSVRKYEPKLALVPSGSVDTVGKAHTGDLFYSRLLAIAQQVEAKVILLEVADIQQAKRVAAMALQQDIWTGVEIWRDHPAATGRSAENAEAHSDHQLDIPIRGVGNGRSVLAYRGQGVDWLGKG